MTITNRSLGKSLLFLSSIAIVLVCNVSCSGGTTKNKVEKSSVKYSATAEKKSKKQECGLVIPDSIKKNVPEEMQYTVFLQMTLSMIRNEYMNELSEGESVENYHRYSFITWSAFLIS